MRVALVGGPFDGYLSQYSDPRAPSIWPVWDGDEVRYRTTPVPGRPRYDRADPWRYVFEGHEEPHRGDLTGIREVVMA